MDNKKSYNLLMFAKTLMVVLLFVLFSKHNLIANSTTSDVDSNQELLKIRQENEYLLLKIDSHNQLNKVLTTENQILNRENLTKELSIENRNFFIFTVLLFSFVALLLSYMLYKSTQKAKLNNSTLHQQNKEIANQKKELEDLNHLKIKFFSIISHDIRSPLLSLKGVLNLFDAQLLNDKKETEEFFSELRAEFSTTSYLLDNLLVWAKKQMYEESIEKIGFPLNQVIEENFNLQKNIISKRGITIFNLLTDDILVFADKEMINMVVRNLINNALKFTPDGGEVSVFYKIENKFIEVGIRDNGIGISENQIERIFDNSFYTTNGLHDEKGNGLGLMLCKEFIEKSQGNLWIKSKVGVGSTFFFTLPLFKNNHGDFQGDSTIIPRAIETVV